MKQQFKTLFLIGLMCSFFNLVYADTIDISEEQGGFLWSEQPGLGSFLQGFCFALAQPFGGFNGVDEESYSYVYKDGNSSSYKHGATAGFTILAAFICKIVHDHYCGTL